MNSVNFSNITLKINDQLIYSPNVNLSTNVSISPSYEVGTSAPSSFIPSSVRSGSVAANFILNSDSDFIYDLCKKEAAAVSIERGGLLIEKAYLSSYRMSARPYSAVGIDVSFTFYEKPQGQVSHSLETVPEKPCVTVQSVTIDEVSNIKDTSLLSVEYSCSNNLEPQIEISESGDLPVIKRVSSANKIIKSKFTTYDYDPQTDMSLPDHKIRITFSNGSSYFVSGKMIGEDFSAGVGEELIRNFEISQGIVEEPPTITSLSASSGAIGTTFTVNGANLSESIAGFIDDYLCEIEVVDSNSVKLTVPSDTFAGYAGPVKIFTHSGEAVSDVVFTVTS